MTIEADGQTQEGASAEGAGQPGAQQQPPAPGQQPPPVFGNGGKEIPPQVISLRLREAQQKGIQLGEQSAFKRLKDKYGVDDIDKFFADHSEMKNKFGELSEAEEKRKRESMSREDALAAELEQVKGERDRLAQENEQLKTGQVRQQQNQAISGIAGRYLKSKFVRPTVEFEFREHVKSKLDAGEIKPEDIDERYIVRWFRMYARENPELALSKELETEQPKEAAAAKDELPPTAKKPPLIRRPITNGAKPERQPPPAGGNSGGNLAGKTPRPGQPNSMTPKEVRAYAKQHGYKMV